MLTALILALVASAPAQQDEVAPLPSRQVGAHEKELVGLGFADKGKSLVTASSSGEIKIWSVRSGKLDCEYRHEDALTAIELNENRKAIAFVSGSTLGAVDVKKAKFKGSVAHPPGAIHCIAWVPKWRWIFAGHDDGLLRRFRGDNLAEPFDSLGTQAGEIRVLRAGPKGDWLAAGNGTGNVYLIDPKNLDVLAELPGHGAEITSLAFDADASTLYSASSDGTVRAWDAGKRRELAVLDGTEAGGAGLRCLDFDPTGKLIAAGGDGGRILIWRAKDRTLLREIEAENVERVAVLEFGPKGKLLATSGPDHSVTLWDVSKLR